MKNVWWFRNKVKEEMDNISYWAVDIYVIPEEIEVEDNVQGNCMLEQFWAMREKLA